LITPDEAIYEKARSGFITSYSFTKNPSYSGNSPLIQNITLKFSANNQDLFASFNDGRIDAMISPMPDFKNEVKRPYNTILFQLPNYYALFFNQTKSTTLKELAVRQALSLAINRTELIKTSVAENAAVVSGPIPPAGAYATKPQTDTYDPNKAKQLLTDAGWVVNEKGIAQKTIGKETKQLEITLTVPAIPFLEKTAQKITQDAFAAGILVNINKVSPEDINQNIIKNRDFEVLLFGNALGPSSDLFSFWHSSQRFFPGKNISIYSNKTVDDTIDAIRRDTVGLNRVAQFEKLQNTITSDYPAIFLYSPFYAFITSTRIKGVESSHISQITDRYNTINAWYLQTSLKLK
jgi:peptide/nickel transport system substrate-binding protein